jgi:hypothetical protein
LKIANYAALRRIFFGRESRFPCNLSLQYHLFSNSGTAISAPHHIIISRTSKSGRAQSNEIRDKFSAEETNGYFRLYT